MKPGFMQGRAVKPSPKKVKAPVIKAQELKVVPNMELIRFLRDFEAQSFLNL